MFIQLTLADIIVTLGSESHSLAFSQSDSCSVFPDSCILFLVTYSNVYVFLNFAPAFKLISFLSVCVSYSSGSG